MNYHHQKSFVKIVYSIENNTVFVIISSYRLNRFESPAEYDHMLITYSLIRNEKVHMNMFKEKSLIILPHISNFENKSIRLKKKKKKILSIIINE